MNQRNPAAKKAAAKAPEPVPAEPIEVTPPPEDPNAVVDVNVDPVQDKPRRVPTDKTILDFKRSAPNYNLRILDEIVASGRGDIAAHRDAIDSAVTEADNRSELMGVFKEDFEDHRVLNMPVLNEAVNNDQIVARDLRGQLWKTIKSLPAT